MATFFDIFNFGTIQGSPPRITRPVCTMSTPGHACGADDGRAAGQRGAPAENVAKQQIISNNAEPEKTSDESYLRIELRTHYLFRVHRRGSKTSQIRIPEEGSYKAATPWYLKEKENMGWQ